MFTVILESFGTAMMFFRPKRFISAGVVSFRYFSCIRLFISLRLFPVPDSLYLSKTDPQRLQTRVRLPSANTLWQMRVCLPQLPQTIMTLEELIPASFSTMPPLIFFDGFGRVWRLMMLACSTI